MNKTISPKNEVTKQEVKQPNNMVVEIKDQSGIENAVMTLIKKNHSLLPNNVGAERIKASAGFYIINSKNNLLNLPGQAKMQMLYGILKEAMVGCEAGTDYDIIPYKGEPTFIRNKNGWFKIIDLIKPSEIIRFTTNVITKDDEYSYDPVTETLEHEMVGDKSQNYEDILGAYAYIKFANGFEKTVFMTKSDFDLLKKISPSGKSEYSPWNSNAIRMVKTKVTKELAKDLVTLFSGRVNSVLANAIECDETSILNVNKDGFITTSDKIYEEPKKHGSDKVIINQEEKTDEIKEVQYDDETGEVVETNINDI